MNKNLNLVEILKNCPKGTKLYSLIGGVAVLHGIDLSRQVITIWLPENSIMISLNKFGKYYRCGECILFPSKTQRDWSKFVVQNKLKEDLPKGTLVLVTETFGDWIVKFYQGKGTASSHTSSKITEACQRWSYIIPFTFVNSVPILEEPNVIEITDENNYGTTYWDRFKE